MKLRSLFKESAVLSTAQKKQIISDIKSWSGGFEPNELSTEQLRKYVATSMPSTFDEVIVFNWLISLR